MKWQVIADHLKREGYTGKPDDLAAVKAFVSDGALDLMEGDKAIDLEAAYADAFPAKKKRDLSGAATNAAVAELQDELKSLREQLAIKESDDELLGKNKGKPDASKAIDIKVGVDRLALDPKGGFSNFGQFCQSAIKAGGAGDRAFDPQPDSTLGKWSKAYNGRVREEAEKSFNAGLISKATLSTYSSEGTGADGGFAVPPEFRAGIMKRIEGEESIAARCDKATLSGNSLTVTIDDTNPWDSSGGIQPTWIGETTAITQSKVLLKQRDFRLRKIGILAPMSEELAQDASFLESYLVRLAGEKIGYAVDDAILHGNAVTRPTGVVGHNGTVSVAKETNQTAATIKANNIQKMWMRALPRSRRTSFWIINPDAQVQLQRMFVQGTKDSNTFIAAGSLVYLPANGLAGQPLDTLMGRPILYHQAAKTLGTVGDIILFDGASYLVCTKASGIESASSIHLWFDQAVNALRFLYRVEGQPWWPSTVTAANGTVEYASFVTLATRS